MTISVCVWYWFIFLSYVLSPFLIISYWTIYIVDFVNKTSRDKGRACAKVETVQSDTSDNTLGRKWPYSGICTFKIIILINGIMSLKVNTLSNLNHSLYAYLFTNCYPWNRKCFWVFLCVFQWYFVQGNSVLCQNTSLTSIIKVISLDLVRV